MTRTLDLTIPHLPSRKLSPNARVHWAVRSGEVKQQRYESGWMAKAEWRGSPPMQQAQICYTFVVTNRRRRDIDNLVGACKSFQDGLVDAGVLVADDSSHLAHGLHRVQYGTHEQTIIRVEEMA